MIGMETHMIGMESIREAKRIRNAILQIPIPAKLRMAAITSSKNENECNRHMENGSNWMINCRRVFHF